ncbi:hypothetical protein T231_04155 [Tannerella sp. oral taxon BU063 isolate Cell 6/7/9]|uniref:Uncharacterized protein n=1 Tax=Tannerella sp. oral taxon BU063 isolate Cell 6/7/9 TaxID=1411021 RepID=W2CU40_9BACT|nr:hypothetical protein T231_04155 [Tannerella sp. oral taxon BU063 isolate Cell 6/7/9]
MRTFVYIICHTITVRIYRASFGIYLNAGRSFRTFIFFIRHAVFICINRFFKRKYKPDTMRQVNIISTFYFTIPCIIKRPVENTGILKPNHIVKAKEDTRTYCKLRLRFAVNDFRRIIRNKLFGFYMRYAQTSNKKRCNCSVFTQQVTIVKLIFQHYIQCKKVSIHAGRFIGRLVLYSVIRSHFVQVKRRIKVLLQ